MRRFASIALFVAFALAALGPIRNYDYFWHLATGRWIVEHRALPLTDPFLIASDRHEWINGEWLFELAAYGAHEIVGLPGMSVVRALLAASIFIVVFFKSRRDLLMTAIAFAGAMQTVDLRPSSVALLFVVLAITARGWIAHAVIAALWINIHPSAILAPGITALSTRRAAPVIASALALLINPHGWRALVAPLELMTFIRTSGAFINAEWLPSRPTQFPLLYLCVLGAAIAFVARRREEGTWWRVLLLAGFAFLAIRHVRNQGLFFAAFPLLIPRFEIRRAIAMFGAVAAITLVALMADHRLGIAPERFPVRAVARLKATGLQGNIYNPDQFGGFLIWSFYPQRRVLTDGRNELHRTFLPEYARALDDQRAWRALLAKYRIDLAVDEYHPPLRVRDSVTGTQTSMPASLAYWPRKDWALIAFDDAGMVFARRAAFPQETLARLEMWGGVPDAPR
ncbi:MAG: hypothetical protein M3P06_08450 [Acidobacteriota bacterium]|nr:hypothetical protein [Acidobacteriota bacterium]